MNREQRRRNKKKAKKQRKEDTIHKIEKYAKKFTKEELINESYERSMITLMGAPLVVLRDGFGFGKKRLEKFLDLMLLQIQCVHNNRVTLDELKKIIKEETGTDVDILMQAGSRRGQK